MNNSSFYADLKKFVNKHDQITPAIAQEVKQRVKARTPVRSGKLRDSWKVSGSVVSSDVDYAPFVELGTRYQKGRFMLTQTLLEAQEIVNLTAKRVS